MYAFIYDLVCVSQRNRCTHNNDFFIFLYCYSLLWTANRLMEFKWQVLKKPDLGRD